MRADDPHRAGLRGDRRLRHIRVRRDAQEHEHLGEHRRGGGDPRMHQAEAGRLRDGAFLRLHGHVQLREVSGMDEVDRARHGLAGGHPEAVRQLRHGGVARLSCAAQQRPRGLCRQLLSGLLRTDGRPVRSSRGACRLAAGPRGRLVHGRRHAPQRRVDAHRLLPLHPRHEPPREAYPGRAHALERAADLPRRDDRI